MDLPQKKTGILLSTAPGTGAFHSGVEAAATALVKGARVFAYCIDDAVTGVGDTRLQALKQQGLILYACAYGANRRRIPTTELATFVGLGVLGDIIASTDEFLSFGGAIE